MPKPDVPRPQTFTKAHEPGTAIKYMSASGKKVSGVIHAVRTYEDPETGYVLRRTYLVDTGKDVRVDKIKLNKRDVEITKRVSTAIANAKEKPNTAEEHRTVYERELKKIMQAQDLPDNEIYEEIIRQPEQVEINVNDLELDTNV